jgi:hypothetical protein
LLLPRLEFEMMPTVLARRIVEEAADPEQRRLGSVNVVGRELDRRGKIARAAVVVADLHDAELGLGMS